jgi:hypothetical protein
MIKQGINEQRRLPELYIFVTSPRADPYVNVLMHLLRNPSVSAVHFIALIEHEYTGEQMDERLSDIEANIGILLDQLTKGFYGDRKIELDPAWAAAYRECRIKLDRISVQRLSVSWDDLDEELQRFISNSQVMFDVTTLKKNLLVDVFALLLSRGWTEIFNFELVTSGEPRYDERGLIHALGPTGFHYRSLAESKHVEKARSRIISRSITFRTVLMITAGVAIVVLTIQLFFANTVLESGILATATVAAIVGCLIPLIRKDS